MQVFACLTLWLVSSFYEELKIFKENKMSLLVSGIWTPYFISSIYWFIMFINFTLLYFVFDKPFFLEIINYFTLSHDKDVFLNICITHMTFYHLHLIFLTTDIFFMLSRHTREQLVIICVP